MAFAATPIAVIAHRLHHHLHMRMRFTRVKDHCVLVLGTKLLPGKVLDRRQDLLRWRPGRSCTGVRKPLGRMHFL